MTADEKAHDFIELFLIDSSIDRLFTGLAINNDFSLGG